MFAGALSKFLHVAFRLNEVQVIISSFIKISKYINILIHQIHFKIYYTKVHHLAVKYFVTRDI